MKLFRISASLAAFSAIALLAACGGGGGGGVTPPGGGGGSTPPPSSGSPTPKPTSTPTASPTSTPTVAPTSTPTTAPSGGTITSNGSVARIYDGTTSPLIFGKDDWQTAGVSTTDTGDGDVAGGFNTPTNTATTIDGVSCTLGGESMLTSTSYHVHSFLGIYVNGVQYAIPDAIGMNNPQGGEPVQTFTDACNIHTHAPSGIIHVEDPSQTKSFTTEYPQYNLQSLLDIWGYNSLQNLVNAISPGFSGSIAVYAGTPCPNNAVGCANPAKNPNTNEDVVSTYTQQAGASSVQFGHHVAIWIIAGSMPASGLPSIDFGISN